MFFQNLQIYYYMNGRKVLSQPGETNILTIESNKSYLQKMFSIFDGNSEIEVIAEVVPSLHKSPIQPQPILYHAFV